MKPHDRSRNFFHIFSTSPLLIARAVDFLFDRFRNSQDFECRFSKNKEVLWMENDDKRLR